ncbi:hypothetical protein D3C79_999990 [compost metagenome]
MLADSADSSRKITSNDSSGITSAITRRTRWVWRPAISGLTPISASSIDSALSLRYAAIRKGSDSSNAAPQIIAFCWLTSATHSLSQLPMRPAK